MIPVSVCMNTRNRRYQLEIALPSVLAQEPAEVVIVDDGSTDGTEEMIRRDFPTVIYHRLMDTGYHKNPAESLNIATDASSQPVIIQQNAELMSVNHCFSLLLDALQPRRPTLARIFNVGLGQAEDVPPWGTPERATYAAARHGQTWYDVAPYDLVQRQEVGSEVYCGHERRRPLFFLGAMTRELWEEIGGYNEDIEKGTDQEFADRLRGAGVSCLGLGDAIGFHIQHGRD